MNKLIIIVLAVVVLVVGGFFALQSNEDDTTNTSQTSNTDTTTQASDLPMNTNQQEITETSEEVLSGEVKIDISDFAYNPEKITIKKGTTVTWTNQDTARHDISPDNPSDAFEGSQLLAQGESYSFTFNTAGIYTYFCSPHPYMQASIEVVE